MEQQEPAAEAQATAEAELAPQDAAAEAAAAADNLTGLDAPQPMSKSQQKKLKKRQLYEEKKLQKRAEEKARKQAEQERRREEGRARMAGMTEEEAAAWREERNARGVARKEEKMAAKARMQQAVESGQRLVVDLDFADLMLDSESKSMCKQVGYAWHANCAAAVPAHLVLTSVQGKMREYMQRQTSGYENWAATVTDKPYLEHFAAEKEKLVYLTADSEHELEELDPQSIYIIGGIVDRNRHKRLCLNKAEEQGIAHARLPIGDYMRLASSAVMTTNHVVDILLKWLEVKDWKQAFESVIPNRKRQQEEEQAAAAGAAAAAPAPAPAAAPAAATAGVVRQPEEQPEEQPAAKQARQDAGPAAGEGSAAGEAEGQAAAAGSDAADAS